MPKILLQIGAWILAVIFIAVILAWAGFESDKKKGDK